jgi:hypothetical protein
MKNYLLFFNFLSLFLSCNSPTEVLLLDKMKPADKFSRTFIDKIINGPPESSYTDIDPQLIDDSAKQFIINANKNLAGATFRKYKIVEGSYTLVISLPPANKEKSTIYRLGYEYEFDKGNILFRTIIVETEGKFYVRSFNGGALPAPLAELTKFTFKNKSILQYAFFVLAAFIPFFIIATFIVMLLSKIPAKKKIAWTFIILFISLPKFIINWDNGEVDFQLLALRLFGSGYYKPNLYSVGSVFFHIPIGAAIYWIRRKILLQKSVSKPIIV